MEAFQHFCPNKSQLYLLTEVLKRQEENLSLCNLLLLDPMLSIPTLSPQCSLCSAHAQAGSGCAPWATEHHSAVVWRYWDGVHGKERARVSAHQPWYGIAFGSCLLPAGKQVVTVHGCSLLTGERKIKGDRKEKKKKVLGENKYFLTSFMLSKKTKVYRAAALCFPQGPAACTGWFIPFAADTGSVMENSTAARCTAPC